MQDVDDLMLQDVDDCPAGREDSPLDHLKGVVPLVVVVHDPKVVDDLTHNEGNVTDVHVMLH